MAKVLAVLTKLSTESDRKFRERCGLFLLSESYGRLPSGAFAVARMTLSADPMGLKRDDRWGLAFDGKPLPSDTCFVSSYSEADARLDLHPFALTDLDRAPVNPGVLPRAAHRMSAKEFREQAAAVPLGGAGHVHDWEVFLDGMSLGFVDGREPADALSAVHRNEVVNALSMLSDSSGYLAGTVLPTPEVFGLHSAAIPAGMLTASRLARVASIVNQPMGWTSSFSQAAQKEGWDVFEVEGRLEIQGVDDRGVTPDDSTVYGLVWHGSDDHHVFARTLVYEASPLVFALMRQSALHPVEAPSAGRREAQGA